MMGRSDRLLSLPANDVERLVLDLPLGPVAGSKSDDGIGSDRQICDEAVAIRRFPHRVTISISKQWISARLGHHAAARHAASGSDAQNSACRVEAYARSVVDQLVTYSRISG